MTTMEVKMEVVNMVVVNMVVNIVANREVNINVEVTMEGNSLRVVNIVVDMIKTVDNNLRMVNIVINMIKTVSNIMIALTSTMNKHIVNLVGSVSIQRRTSALPPSQSALSSGRTALRLPWESATLCRPT